MKLKILLICLSSIVYAHTIQARSIFRPKDPLMPEISVRWVGDTKSYTLRNYHLEEYSLFRLFKKDQFEKYLLPTKPFSYRSDTKKTVDPALLTNQIQELLQEIKQGKRNFTHFTTLQCKDYNFKKPSGLIIVKFNDYPFVVKLFIETPDSFVSPFDKGFEPMWVFFMAGGINRHILGFTRLRNREIIMERLAHSPWKDTVDIPRKWYWVPPGSRWIEIEGKNIGSSKHKRVQIPSTYCVIADAIEAERTPSLFNTDDAHMALEICNYLDHWIDPHMKNFMIEKNTKKFVIVDTEHFPSFVGLREKITFNSYTDWYLYLANKCWHATFMQTKRERRNPQQPAPEMSLVMSS